MTDEDDLVKTLPLPLKIKEGNPQQLHNSCLEARTVYNQTIKHAKDGTDWDNIDTEIEAELVKNTKQRIVAKSLEAMENYYEYDDYQIPSHTKSGEYPLRMNYTEGYNLSIENNKIHFRVSTKPYRYIKGTVEGDPPHLDILERALTTDEWSIGTAEAFFKNGKPELHVNVTHQEEKKPEIVNPTTVVGVDINEDNVSLTALSSDGVEDTLVVDFPEIKYERHRFFTIRKRIQNAGKNSVQETLSGREKRFVSDKLHKVSRVIVEFSRKFSNPCIVFEDLKDIREDMDYGTRMNRRLHHLPFHALQQYTSYKAGFQGIPVGKINPEYTSQACSLTNCGQTEKANRNRKRFKCKDCGHQDHSDRNASVNIAKKGIEKYCNWNVPALKKLPQVRKLRQHGIEASEQPNRNPNTRLSPNKDSMATECMEV